MQSPARHEAPEGKQAELVRTRPPRRPYAADRLGGRLPITSTRRTLRRRDVQVSPPWMRVFAILDRLQFHACGRIKHWCGESERRRRCTRGIWPGASSPGDA